MLKSYLAEGNCVVLEFGRHPAVEGAKPMATQLHEYRETPGAFDTPLSCKYGPDLRYVTRTLPVEFVDKSGDGFVPKQAKTYPKPVLCVSPSCSMKRRGRRRRRDDVPSERGRRVERVGERVEGEGPADEWWPVEEHAGHAVEDLCQVIFLTRQPD